MDAFHDDAFASGRNWHADAFFSCLQNKEHENGALREVEEALWAAHADLKARILPLSLLLPPPSPHHHQLLGGGNHNNKKRDDDDHQHHHDKKEADATRAQLCTINYQHEQAMNAACLLAHSLARARDTLSVLSRGANERMLLLVNTLPDAVRDAILIRVGPRKRAHAGVCAAEVYTCLLEKTAPTSSSIKRPAAVGEDEERATLARLMAFVEGQVHMMECIRAHRVVHTACGTMEEHRVVVHRMCGCGGCAFMLK